MISVEMGDYCHISVIIIIELELQLLLIDKKEVEWMCCMAAEARWTTMIWECKIGK